MSSKRSKSPHVSFIVVGWNNRDILDKCLDSIRMQTYTNFSIIYVDNGSVDGSVSFIRSAYPEVVCIEVGKNEGFAIGNNIGINQALQNKECAYVALINSDAALDKDWLASLISFAAEHPHFGSLQTPTYDYYDHSILDSYGIVVDHYGRAMQMGYRSVDDPPETRVVFGTNAAASLYSRDFLDAQPFGSEYLDADMWMYLEDVDIAARATVMGWHNWFVNESAAFHMGSASSGKNPGFSVYYIYRNNFPMLYKNFPTSILVRMIPGLLITDIKTIISLLKGRNRVALKALLRGRLAGILLLIKMYRKRRAMQKVRTVTIGELWRLMGQG